MSERADTSNQVAIIGVEARLPGAPDVASLWELLREGREGVRFLSEPELAAAGVPGVGQRSPLFVGASASLPGIELFDAAFFGFNPREAELLDPQVRILLECAVAAFQDAGHDPLLFRGPIGVFAGAGMSGYLQENLAPHRELLARAGGLQVSIGNAPDSLASLVSYKLDLKGPSLTVQTACSTSLVAVHLACQSLLSGECDMALAGGVSLKASPPPGYLYQEGGIFSKDGHTRTFDAKATGTIMGNGVGLVVLRRLEDALADGDPIRAVVLGSAVNNDGNAKGGYTAPSVTGHARVVSEALGMARVSPRSLGYVEAHGTGTVLGDPIEVEGLTRAFREGTSERAFCSLGSLKTNVGHLDHAAGVAGLIKAVLALEHRQIPASLHFAVPNPKIDFASGPFRVNTVLTDWEAGPAPRRAGVSSLGMGGTNAHAVLQEAPPRVRTSSPSGPHLLVLSARSEAALDAASDKLARHLRAHPEQHLADVAHTLKVGRPRFACRRVVLAADREEAAAAFGGDPARARTGLGQPSSVPCAFLFPGQGAQYPGMGRGLYERFPAFRRELDGCARVLDPILGRSLTQILFAEEASSRAEESPDETRLALPASFAIEYALARLWMAAGITPLAMLGHGVGEWVAATIGGVFRLEDALGLVALRGRLMAAPPPGGALSPLREEAVGPFAEAVAGVSRTAPQARIVSNVTGDWLGAQEAQDPLYWARAPRAPARLAEGLGRLLESAGVALLEVGPGQTLVELARRHSARNSSHPVFSSLPAREEGGDEEKRLLQVAGEMWIGGVNLDWPRRTGEEGLFRVHLPTYPFERERYWVDPAPRSRSEREAQASAGSPVQKRPSVAAWLYRPAWRGAATAGDVGSEPTSSRRWLVFSRDDGSGASFIRRLREAGHQVVEVRPGRTFESEGPLLYRLDARRAEDYRHLLRRLEEDGVPPTGLLHLWTLGEGRESTDAEAWDLGFHSLRLLAGALEDRPTRFPCRVITTGAVSLGAGEELRPAKAALLAAAFVLRQEVPRAPCGVVDVPLPSRGSAEEERLLRQLLEEMDQEEIAPCVAFRGGFRFTPAVEAVRGKAASDSRIRPGAVVLITGGLGRVGLAFARFLAERGPVKLALLGRSSLPPKSEWAEPLTRPEDPESMRVEALKSIEALGGEVLVLSADVADEGQLRAAVARTRERFGPIDAVIHAAGVLDGAALCPLRELSLAECERQFRPKVEALPVLDRVLSEAPPGLVLLVSSLAAVLGGVGYGAYAAANAYMDAFVEARHLRGRLEWMSVDFDAFASARAAAAGTARAELEGLAMSASEAGEALLRVTAGRSVRWLVSTADLEARMIRALGEDSSGAGAAAPKSEGRPAHPRPNLLSVYVAPETSTERRLALLWGEQLGLAQVGLHDNFFELGGTSLTAVQMMPGIRSAFGVDLPLAALFEGPTVHSMGRMIDERAAQGGVLEPVATSTGGSEE